MVEYMNDTLDKLMSLLECSPSLINVSKNIRKEKDGGVRFYTDDDMELQIIRSHFEKIYDFAVSQSQALINVCINHQKELSFIKDIKYSKSNPVLVRGFYCPLPYVHKKGRLISNPDHKGFLFKYYFKDNVLYCTERIRDQKIWSKEFMFYRDNVALGIFCSGNIDNSFCQFFYDEYFENNIIQRICFSGSNFEIEEYEYLTDDVSITRVRFDVKRHMGKRWAITTDYSCGKQYSD